MAWRWRKGKSIRPPENGFLRGCWLMVNRYLGHNVPIQAAALAFYLLFMIFPLTIFFSALLGSSTWMSPASPTPPGSSSPARWWSFWGCTFSM